MRIRQLVNNTVGAQEAKFTADGSRTELAPIHRLQQRQIGSREGVQGAYGPAVPAGTFLDDGGLFS